MRLLRAFLDQITQAYAADPAALRSELRQQRDKFVQDNLPVGASGQVGSACGRFGLIATAGEFATRLDLTGWPEGEATDAAQKCFRAWLAKRGSAGDYDLETAIRRVIAYVEKFGNSRFEDLNVEGFTTTGLRVGFRKDGLDGVEYYVLTEMWKDELCQGYDHRAVAEEMLRRRSLIGSGGRTTVSMRLGRHGQMRVYRLAPGIINGGADPDTRTEAEKRCDLINFMMSSQPRPMERGVKPKSKPPKPKCNRYLTENSEQNQR